MDWILHVLQMPSTAPTSSFLETYKEKIKHMNSTACLLYANLTWLMVHVEHDLAKDLDDVKCICLSCKKSLNYDTISFNGIRI